VAGHPLPEPRAADADANEELIFPAGVAGFVSEMIEEGLNPPPRGAKGEELSFVAIVETLKDNEFQIVSGVDAAEVSAFVGWVESAETSFEWE
jgi:hypothetical protein